MSTVGLPGLPALLLVIAHRQACLSCTTLPAAVGMCYGSRTVADHYRDLAQQAQQQQQAEQQAQQQEGERQPLVQQAPGDGGGDKKAD